MVEWEIILVSVLFLVFGAITSFKPQWYIRFVQWQTKKIWKAEFRPTKATEVRMRILSILFWIFGLWLLYYHLILGKT